MGVIGLKAGLSIPLFHLKHKVGAHFYFNTTFVSGAYKLIYIRLLLAPNGTMTIENLFLYDIFYCRNEPWSLTHFGMMYTLYFLSNLFSFFIIKILYTGQGKNEINYNPLYHSIGVGFAVISIKLNTGFENLTPDLQ